VDVSSVGTKRPSLTTRFEGPYDTMQLIWNKVKSVAALYSAAMTCTQNQSRPFPTWDELAMAFSNEDDAAFSNPELLPASCFSEIDSFGRFPRAPTMYHWDGSRIRRRSVHTYLTY
jgi:hypothetical protein